MFDGHGHASVTGLHDTPEAGEWDSGDEAADVEAFEFTADASGEAAMGVGISWRDGKCLNKMELMRWGLLTDPS